MLGLIGALNYSKLNQFDVVPGANCQKVNLQPWDAVSTVEVSPKYPNGIKRIAAATQEQFQAILNAIPEKSQIIGTLSVEQERAAKESLKANCLWYQEQLAKELPLKEDIKKSFSSTPTKQ